MDPEDISLANIARLVDHAVTAAQTRIAVRLRAIVADMTSQPYDGSKAITDLANALTAPQTGLSPTLNRNAYDAVVNERSRVRQIIDRHLDHLNRNLPGSPRFGRLFTGTDEGAKTALYAVLAELDNAPVKEQP